LLTFVLRERPAGESSAIVIFFPQFLTLRSIVTIRYVVAHKRGVMCAFVLLLLPVAPVSASLPGLPVDQLVQEALAANLELKARRFDIDIAEAELITARLRENPELVVGYENFKPGGFYSEETETAVGVEFVIEGPGKRRIRIAEATQASRAAAFEFEDAIRDLVLEVQEAAIEVMLAEEGLALAQVNLETAASIVELNEARYRAGDIDGVELRRTRLLLPQARNEVRALEMELENSIRDLNLLLGRSNPVFSVNDRFRELDVLPSLDQALASAIARRPDLHAMLAEQRRAAADLRLQQVERRPDFTVGTEVRRFRGDGNYAGLTFSVPLQIFDRNQGGISRAQSELYRADAMVMALRANIENEVGSAYRRLVLNADLLTSVQLEVEEAEELRRITELSYRSGEAGLLEILDALSAYNDAMESYNEIRAEIARDLYLFDYFSAAPVMP